jgi:gas vesicle protein
MASKKSFFSLLAGLAAGAAIGILYAPDKGWKTRARVKKAAENGYDDLKENLGDLGSKVDEKTAQAKASIKDLRETLREKGTEIKESTREMLLKQLERLENALKQAEEEAEETFAENPGPEEQAPEA